MKKIIFICLVLVAHLGLAKELDSHLLNVTSSGLNLLITPKKATNYPEAGIKIVTSGYTVQSGCRYSNGYCMFPISNGQVAQLTLSKPGAINYIICLNAKHQLQCQHYQSVLAGSNFSKIYIANSGSGNTGYISYCSLINGTIDSSTCKVAAPDALGITDPAYLSINNKAKKVYYTRPGPSVTTCSLNTNGTISGPCTSNVGFNFPSALLYNAEFNKLYVANTLNNSVSVCSLDTGGKIVSCSNKSGLNSATGIAINLARTKIYVTDKGNGVVHVCGLDSTGAITTCPYSTPINSFNNPYGVTINDAANKIYIANSSSDSISICQLAANGSIVLGTCTQKTGFNSPRGVAFNAVERKLYVTQYVLAGVVSVCNLTTAGVISSCQDFPDNFVFPSDITLN